MIFSYVERNTQFAAGSNLKDHRGDASSKRSYLFSRRFRDDDHSLCDALLDDEPPSSGQLCSEPAPKRSLPNERYQRTRPPLLAKRSSPNLSYVAATSSDQRLQTNDAGRRSRSQQQTQQQTSVFYHQDRGVRLPLRSMLEVVVIRGCRGASQIVLIKSISENNLSNKIHSLV
ncbi:hypothetical protein M3Y97_00993200 [Aphelenchoides bicaudatus]|nr:hypothetical protein M3Y97_00993200 [Aphelenchoides bicaudatus]